MNINIRNYLILQELGRGTFGVTYLGYNKTTHQEVAVKTIDINKSLEKGVDITKIDEEIATLRELSTDGSNKYIATYYDSFDDIFNGVPTKFIISEFISGGSLTHFIQDIHAETAGLSPSVLWPIALQLISGLKFIHDKGFAHRDIKPDNILIDDFVIKYIDFGTACVDHCRINACTNECTNIWGTTIYMPPEDFDNTNEFSLKGAKAHDVWSLALVLFELFNGPYQFPFTILDQNGNMLPDNEIIQHRAHAPEYSSNYKSDRDGRTNKFLDSLIVVNWRQRPTIDTVLSNFIDNISTKIWLCTPKNTVPQSSFQKRNEQSVNLISQPLPIGYTQSLPNPESKIYPQPVTISQKQVIPPTRSHIPNTAPQPSIIQTTRLTTQNATNIPLQNATKSIPNNKVTIEKATGSFPNGIKTTQQYPTKSLSNRIITQQYPTGPLSNNMGTQQYVPKTQYNPGTQQYGAGTQQYGVGTQQYRPKTQYDPGTQQYGAGTQQYGVGTQPSEVVTQPYGVGTQPYEVVTQPYGVGTQPYGVGTQPYGVGTQPYGVGTQPYGVGTQPYGVGTLQNVLRTLENGLGVLDMEYYNNMM